jgi:hypothetical protein
MIKTLAEPDFTFQFNNLGGEIKFEDLKKKLPDVFHLNIPLLISTQLPNKFAG